MDRLAYLFKRFAPGAEVYFTGRLCEAAELHAGGGHLHLLRAGSLQLQVQGRGRLSVSEPSVVFLPRALPHMLLPEEPGAELVCARVELGQGAQDGLLSPIPEVLVVPLARAPELGGVLDLLFDEAAGERCGRRAALDSLARYLLVILLRYLIDREASPSGLLAGLADPRLSQALTAMHESPGVNWTLELLAEKACMSRARFAALFRQTMGATPLGYLTDWRLAIAQSLLQQGRPLKTVATAVGYRSPAAFTRVFSRRLGCPPSAWLAKGVDA